MGDTSTPFPRHDSSQSASDRNEDHHRRGSDLSPHSTPQKPPLDARSGPPRLSPSPKFKEPPSSKRLSSDIHTTPPRISRAGSSGTSSLLQLQMPQRDSQATPAKSADPDARESYESPGSVLPRHSRGLDFSRARTNLHHSTLPDLSTPGSSPIVTAKNGIDIPPRRGSVFAGMNDSPRSSFTSGWYTGQDRFFRPHSMGSGTALTSDASGSSSDEDDNQSRRDEDEDMLATPQVNKEMNFNAVTPYGTREETITGGMVHNPSPMQRRFHPFRRNRVTKGVPRVGGWRGRSDSLQKSSEETTAGLDGSDDVAMHGLSRRDSISTVTDKLAISKGIGNFSNGNDSGDEGPFKFQSNTGVVRRPVTRRSNLLPKTKGFARIKAALQEESSPVDSDCRREAEVVHQVRVNDLGGQARGQSMAPTSPDLTPNIPNMPMDASDMSDIDGLGLSHTTSASSDPVKTLPPSQSQKPPYERRNSGFRELWPRLHTRLSTPPPTTFNRPRSSSGVSGISEDMRLDSPLTHTPASNDHESTPGANASDPDATVFQLPNLPSAAEISKKVSKRRRDDDFDPASIKRRAVSPGMSVHSSPVLGQSPVSSSGGWWGQAQPQPPPAAASQSQGRSQRENSGSSAPEDRSASLGSNAVQTAPPTPGLGPKRVGMQQGMNDTNDGLNKMSID